MAPQGFDPNQSNADRFKGPFRESKGPLSRATVLRGDGAGDVTVSEFVDYFKQFAVAIKERRWGDAYRISHQIGLTFADLMDAGAFSNTPHMMTLDDQSGNQSRALAATSEITGLLDECRSNAAQATQAGPRLRWDGDPNPVSGAPAPAAPVHPAKSLDPATILVAVETVSRIWAQFVAWKNSH